jgi:hypothetical protein
MKKFSLRKYNGDDAYSWAVFRSEDLRGLGRGPIFYGQATPIVAGCSKREALSYKRQFENEKR